MRLRPDGRCGSTRQEERVLLRRPSLNRWSGWDRRVKKPPADFFGSYFPGGTPSD